jgi:hypothetical protein
MATSIPYFKSMAISFTVPCLTAGPRPPAIPKKMEPFPEPEQPTVSVCRSATEASRVCRPRGVPCRFERCALRWGKMLSERSREALQERTPCAQCPAKRPLIGQHAPEPSRVSRELPSAIRLLSGLSELEQ